MDSICIAIGKTLLPEEKISFCLPYGYYFISCYEPVLKKNGQPGIRTCLKLRLFTPLLKCELCKKISTPKKIQSRYVIGYDYLCMGCWNKCRPIENKQNELDVLKKMRNKLRTLSTNHRVKKDEKI